MIVVFDEEYLFNCAMLSINLAFGVKIRAKISLLKIVLRKNEAKSHEMNKNLFFTFTCELAKFINQN